MLFRPATRKENLAGVNRFGIGDELEHIPNITAIRVNHRLNTAAVDTTNERSRDALLATHTLCGVEVRAQLARGVKNARGVLRDIDLPGDAADIVKKINTPIPILQATRRDASLFVTFDGPEAPEYVTIANVRIRVQRLAPRPIQCDNCGRFNHYTSTCRSAPRCKNCSGQHVTNSCTEHTQKCANCGGAHHYSSPRCRLWKREQQIATKAARQELPPSEARRQFFRANTNSARAGRSYSEALQSSQPRRQTPAITSAVPSGQNIATALAEAAKALNAAIALLQHGDN